MLNVAAFLPRSEVNGPGVRAVVWVQGCPRAPICPGCYNPDLLDTGAVRTTVTPEDLAREILEVPGLDGVTFSGGEPFHQAKDLAALAATLRASGLTVTVFSGHTLEELRASPDPDWHALLAEIDLLIDGPYVQALASPDLPLRGSANQRLWFLTGRIGPHQVAEAREVELTIAEDGEITGTGVADARLLARLRPSRDR